MCSAVGGVGVSIDGMSSSMSKPHYDMGTKEEVKPNFRTPPR
jgi:hypothetical protein